VRAFGTFLGLALLLLLLGGGYLLFKYVAGVFSTLEPQVETLAAIASVVALLCAVIIAEGLKARTQGEDGPITAAEKARAYERLLFQCCEQLRGEGNAESQTTDVEIARIEQFLALHGSAKVIAAYVDLRRVAKEEGQTGDATSSLLNRLLVEMRADLGRSGVIRSDNDLLDLLLRRNKA
jgi:hypothetical protein